MEVSGLAKELSEAAPTIAGSQTSPKHEIETGKLRRLGMSFGGSSLLRATIQELVTGPSD